MNYQIYFLFASAIAFTGYILYITLKYGVQSSISKSYYVLPGKVKYLFTFATWSYSMPILLIAESGWLFYSAAFIVFVGAAPAFNNSKMENIVHMTGAIGGVILGLIQVFLFGHWILIVILAGLAGYSKLYDKDYIWNSEIFAYATIWTSLIIHYL